MKPGLKRIEATLDQLTIAEGLTPSTSEQRQPIHPSEAVPSTEGRSKSSVKAIQPFPVPKAEAASVAALAPNPVSQPVEHLIEPVTQGQSAPLANRSSKSSKAKKAPPARNQHPNKLSPVVKSGVDSLPMPKSKPPSFSSHRHAVNPDLAIGLLKEVEAVVLRWQLDLEQTVLEIQALYLEGPIVDGWLESHPVGSPQVMQPIGTATLRHAEIDRLMDYVEEICRMPQTLDPNEAPRTGYRLCGLDADGTLWSRPCPPEQVPYVGLAIARYQKLRILLARKQSLENRLNQLIQNLTFLHGQMQEGH
jgi:hypothetical protein